jgi:predicted transcriptional regulator
MANQDQAPPHLGELEQTIMEIVWQRQQATVREVVGELLRTPPLAYTTVATVMSRLVEKGLLVRSRAGKVDLYRPVYDSEEFGRRAALAAVEELVREYGDVALAQFAAALDQADPGRIARLRARYRPQELQAPQRPTQKDERDAEA